MYIVIDYDGTCVTHEYPNIGKDIGAIPVLKGLIENKHSLILYTMRADNHVNDDGFTRHTLFEAVSWFVQNGIPLYGIQTNPSQSTWTTSIKPYGHLYIDDAGLGIPLKWDKELSRRPFVDWALAEKLLEERGFLPKPAPRIFKTEPDANGNT